MARTWFITGVSSGIGTAIAKAALGAGDTVIGTARNLDKAHRAFENVDTGKLTIVGMDVTDPVAVDCAVANALDRAGGIDVAVNNAGYCLLGNFEESTLPEIEAQFATNFYGVVHVMRAVLPIMRQQRSGRIINIGASGAVGGLAHCSAYCATKFAIEGLAFSIAPEIEKFGIHITTVEPGMFRTDMLADGTPRYVEKTGIKDYADEQSAETMWSPYHGTQAGDPERLGAALLEIVAMEKPPRTFIAGSDAIGMIMPNIETRVAELKQFEALSRSTDGEAA